MSNNFGSLGSKIVATRFINQAFPQGTRTTTTPAPTTTQDPNLTTTQAPNATTTTQAPNATTTTQAPAVTTTQDPAVTTTQAPAVTTTQAPAVTTTQAPNATTTTQAPTTTQTPLSSYDYEWENFYDCSANESDIWLDEAPNPLGTNAFHGGTSDGDFSKIGGSPTGMYEYLKLRVSGSDQDFDPRYLHPQQLKLWLDASDSSTITSTNGKVSLWEDKSQEGNDASQATSSLQVSIGSSTQNSLNYLQFSDAQYLDLTNDFNFAGKEVFVVAKNEEGNGVGQIMGGSADNNQLRFGYGRLQWTSGESNPYDTQTSSSVLSSGWGIYSFKAEKDGGNLKLYENGSLVGTSTGTHPLATSDQVYDLSIGRIGSYSLANQFLKGQIGEIIVVDNAYMTTGQTSEYRREYIEAYLAKKWDIDLVSSHSMILINTLQQHQVSSKVFLNRVGQVNGIEYGVSQDHRVNFYCRFVTDGSTPPAFDTSTLTGDLTNLNITDFLNVTLDTSWGFAGFDVGASGGSGTSDTPDFFDAQKTFENKSGISHKAWIVKQNENNDQTAYRQVVFWVFDYSTQNNLVVNFGAYQQEVGSSSCTTTQAPTTTPEPTTTPDYFGGTSTTTSPN